MHTKKGALALAVTAALLIGSADARNGSALRLARSGAAAQPNGALCDSGGICLTVGVAPVDPVNPDLCGTQTSIDAVVGDQIDVCYTVTNDSSATLNYHSLEDDADGSLFELQSNPLAPGATLEHHRVVTAATTEMFNSTWTAYTERPGYDAAPGDLDPGSPDICTDRVFAGDFEETDVPCDHGTPNDFIAIEATGTALDLSDDDAVSIALPFAFDFYGRNASELCIANNGYILVDAPECLGLFFVNEPLPAPSLGAGALLPLWDDLYVGGNVYTQTIGTTPNRKFVVEWHEKDHYPDPGGGLTGEVTFEVVFGEDGSLAYNYLDTAFDNNPDWDNGGSATIGLQGSPILADEYSSDTASLSDLFRMEWAERGYTSFSASDVGVTVNVVAPAIDVAPDLLDGTAAAGETTTVALDIGNIGTSALHWTIGEASPASHFVAYPGAYRFSMPAPRAAERALAMTSARPARTHDTKSQQRPAMAIGDAPAFGTIAGLPGDYIGFDVEDPSTYESISEIPLDPLYKTGTFVNGAFDKQYVASISFGVGTATIDTATGEVTPLGGPPTVADELWFGLKWDPVDGALYGVGCTKEAPSTCHLYDVNPFSGAVTEIAPITGIADPDLGTALVDIAISPAGLMYGIDYNTGDLVAIDKTTGAGQIIGSTGYAPMFVQSLDFDQSTGLLYWAAFDGEVGTMFTVDLATAELSTVGPLAESTELFAFAIANAGGPCVNPADQSWISVDPLSGTTAPASATPVAVTLDATSLAAGSYEGSVCVFSDDPRHGMVAVPVSFEVTQSAVPPTLTKSFTPATVESFMQSQLRLTLSNANPVPATLTAVLQDVLPANLVVGATPNASTTCGGTLGGVTPGSSTITLTPNGSSTIPPNGSCTIRVDVRSGTPGTYVNTIPVGALQTTVGNSVAAASATLTVTAFNSPTLAKTFFPSTVPVDTPSRLTITLGNSNATGDGLSAPLTDTFPPGLVVAPNPNSSTTCGGAVTATPGAASVALAAAGSIIPGNSSCRVDVDVQAAAAGDFANTLPAGALQTLGGGPNVAAAAATLTVVPSGVPLPPTVAKTFEPAMVPIGSSSTLTITLGSDNDTDAVLDQPLVDTFPAGLVVAAVGASTTCNAALTAGAGDSSVSLDAGATIPAHGTCTITVPVASATAGTYDNTIAAGALSTNLGDSTTPAQATLTVTALVAPTLAMTFVPANVAWNETSKLTVTLANANATAATLLAPLTDTLPASLVVAATPNASNTCGGTLTAAAGADTISLADAAIPANGNCAFEVDVVGIAGGDFANTIAAGALITNAGSNADAVTANLKVSSPSAPTVGVGFSPTSVPAGTAATMTLTLSNANASPVSLVSAFAPALPGGLVVATPANASTTCGGTLTANAGDGTLSMDAVGASIPSLGACTITVDVVSAGAGAYATIIVGGALATTAGANATVSGHLIVTGAFPAPYCLISFNSFVEPITLVDFAGISNASPATVDLGGSPSQSQDMLAVTGAVAPNGGYTMTVKGNTDGNYDTFVRAFFDWNHDGVFGAGESLDIGGITNSSGVDAIEARRLVVVPPTATPGLTRMRVVKAYSFYPSACGNNGYGQAEDYLINVDTSLVPPATPVLVTSAMAPDYLAGPGLVSTLTLTLTNYNAAPLALTADLVDTLPAGLVIADTPNASTKCQSGVPTAMPGGTNFSLGAGARVPANGSCIVQVDVTSPTAGIFVNTVPEGAAQTANGGNPYPTSATVQFASVTGAATYSTGFEPPFATGLLNNQFNWRAGANIAAVPIVDNSSPASGTQHVTMTSTSSTTTPNYPLILSPLQPIGTSPYSYASARLRLSRTGNGASWEFDPQDFANGLVVARVRFDKLAARNIQVRDFVGGTFVNTGAQWPVDTYFTIKVVVERATGAMDVCVDGTLIHHDGNGATVGSRNVTDVAILQGLQASSSAGNTLMADDFVIDNAPAGGCGP